MSKITIIVPVYNREGTLSKCVDSILSQSFQDFDIILVDDGSTDNSLNICREYQAKHDRITVIRKKNGGVSSARNIGLSHANGEWIRFVDSDDYLPLDSLEIFNSAVKSSNADFYISNFITKTPSGKELILDVNDAYWKGDTYKALIYTQKLGISGVPWNKLFRRDIIEKHNIKFDETMRCFEDEVFSLQYMKYADSTCVISHPTYIYMDDQSSRLSHSFLSIEARKYAAEQIYKLSVELSNREELVSESKKHMALIMFMGIKYVHYYGTVLPFKERILHYRSIIRTAESQGIYDELLDCMRDTYRIRTTNPYVIDIISFLERTIRQGAISFFSKLERLLGKSMVNSFKKTIRKTFSMRQMKVVQ